MASTTTSLKPEIIRQAESYKKALWSAGIPVAKLIVFGSQTKGNARLDSDIDVAVVSSSFGKDYHEELVKLLGISTQESPDIEPHPFHPDDLDDRWSTLVYEIKKHGIEV